MENVEDDNTSGRSGVTSAGTVAREGREAPGRGERGGGLKPRARDDDDQLDPAEYARALLGGDDVAH